MYTEKTIDKIAGEEVNSREIDKPLIPGAAFSLAPPKPLL